MRMLVAATSRASVYWGTFTHDLARLVPFLTHLLRTRPLWAGLGLCALLALSQRLVGLRLAARSGLAELDKMDGQDFERYIGSLFRRIGYKTEPIAYVRDGSADMVVTSDGVRHAVQAKPSNRPVGPDAVLEVVAAKETVHAEEAIVVTNQEFTASARRAAKANGVKLWERQHLAGVMLTLRRHSEMSDGSEEHNPERAAG